MAIRAVEDPRQPVRAATRARRRLERQLEAGVKVQEETIRAAEERGVTQTELAELTGFTQQRISQIVNGG